MATSALGPTLAGGMQPIVKNGYELIYYPDVNNDALQREGKPPVFYWLPNYIHLARKDGKTDGDLMFNLIRFAGMQSADTTVGITSTEDNREVAGGVLAFTVTSAPPDTVLLQSQQEIISKFQGQNDYFWGIRSQATPIFRPVIIMSNITAVSNLSPDAEGAVPGPAAPAGGDSRGHQPSSFSKVPVPRMITQKGFSPKNFGKTRNNGSLDAWYWNMQGQGNGSIDPMGQNAYAALVGVYPTSIMWAAFHGSYSPIFVNQALKIKFWVPVIEITIKGNWEKVFTHFSAHATGRYLWFSGDIKAEFNNMRTSGTLEVDVKVDETIPGGDKIREYVDKKTDMVFNKFMEQAKDAIFDIPQPEVEAAQASSGGGLFGIWGAGLALKFRRDQHSLDLYYHEKRQMSYLQDHTISSSLEGLNEALENNPEAERKYFQTVYMDDWPRKLGRIIKPIVNWPKPEQNWAGEPVAFVSAQVGYPNTRGELMWVGKTFQKSDPPETSWSFGITQKQEADVENPPEQWTPDVTFVKRKVHMMEPPDPAENPYIRVQISDNEIELDPDENGSPLNEVALEVRADEAGKIRVGPLSLNVDLESAKQIVEVTFQATDQDGNDLQQFSPVKFSWNYEDQTTPRFWAVFTSEQSVRSYYKYQVRVIVKGSLFTKGMEWTSSWIRTIGNGPLMISVPTPEDEGVTVVRQYRRETHEPAPAAGNGHGSSQPPASREYPSYRGSKKTEDMPELSDYSYDASKGELKKHMPPSKRKSGKRGKTKGNGAPEDTLEITYWKPLK